MHALGLAGETTFTGRGHLSSRFAVTELAAQSFAAIGHALAELMTAKGLLSVPPGVTVDRRLASLWFGFSIHPVGWEMPPVWDAIAGDYETRDGWIRLHTNLLHHRAATCRVLGTEAERAAIAQVVKTWDGDDLETAIIQEGGVAAVMRSLSGWQAHPQGAAVADEPLIAWEETPRSAPLDWPGTEDRPLRGLRILDLTRVLAGPVATRTLAGFGAEVLRIDPPGWDEANVIPEVSLGKRCARMDLRTPGGLRQIEELLAGAHILVHGYRPGVLDRLGLGAEKRRELAPDLIDISLNAYGWTGPWTGRRGFDSLVQMSTGIAYTGMEWAGADKPTPLPCQALDFATGYLMAASALKALERGLKGKTVRARLSLARTAALLAAHEQGEGESFDLKARKEDLDPAIEETSWGPARRLLSPISIGRTSLHWDRPATALGAALPHWARRAP